MMRGNDFEGAEVGIVVQRAPAQQQLPTGVSEDLGIVPGKRGTLETVVGEALVSEERPAVQKIARIALYAVSAVTLFPGLYLLSKQVVVPSGYIGIGMSATGKSEVLPPGMHCLVSPANRRSNFRLFPLTDKDIHWQDVHVVQIKDDEYGLATDQGKPLILGPGVHVTRSPFFVLLGRVPQSAEVIEHLDLHRIIVPEGRRGIALDGQRPILLEAGIFTKKSSVLTYKGSFAIDERVVHLGPFLIVTPFEGEVGVAYKGGRLEILHPGPNFLYAEKNDEFLGLIPTTEQDFSLKDIDVLTSDGLAVKCEASLAFRIRNPLLAVRNIGESREAKAAVDPRHSAIKEMIFDSILKKVRDSLSAMLTGSDLITMDALLMVQSFSDPTTSSTTSSSKRPPKTELFKKINAAFMADVGARMLAEWGVEVRHLIVTEIQASDPKVQDAMADGVRMSIEAAGMRESARLAAETARITAEGEAVVARIKTDADAYRIREIARAQEEAGRMLERVPTAVQIRLAEAGAEAIGKAGSVVVVKDAGAQGLLALMGAQHNAAKEDDHTKTE